MGRSLWALDLEDESAVLLEHRARRFCRFGRDFDLSSLFLGSFPVSSLPALLLGRVPMVPVGAPLWEPTGDQGSQQRLIFLDAQGRQWTAILGDRMEGWEVRNKQGELRAQVGREEEGWWLRDKELGLKLRWKQTVTEAQSGKLSPLPIPKGYREGGCLGVDPKL